MKILLTLLLSSSCSIFFGGKEAPKTAKGSLYTINFSEPDWVYQKNNRSDYIFENSQDGRIMLSNSFCDEFQEQPLENLAKKTFSTIKNFKSSISKYTTFQDREAYHLEGIGQVDGVVVGVRLLNTRRDNCYYDFLAITPEKAKEQHSSFVTFLKTVVFR